MKNGNTLTPLPFNYNNPERLLASLLGSPSWEANPAFNEYLARMQVSYLEGRSPHLVNTRQRVYNNMFSKHEVLRSRGQPVGLVGYLVWI